MQISPLFFLRRQKEGLEIGAKTKVISNIMHCSCKVLQNKTKKCWATPANETTRQKSKRKKKNWDENWVNLRGNVISRSENRNLVLAFLVTLSFQHETVREVIGACCVSSHLRLLLTGIGYAAWAHTHSLVDETLLAFFLFKREAIGERRDPQLSLRVGLL